MKKFYSIFIIAFIISCADDPSTQTPVEKINVPDKNVGVQISNDLPRGSIYVDTSEKTYAFRSIEGFIKNDTLVPIKIQIDIPKSWTDLEPKQGQKYICFLLPDSMTPEKQYDFALANRHVSPQLNNLITTKASLQFYSRPTIFLMLLSSKTTPTFL